jgi:divalent metal cation (Fe/Co/Zn/Cd) transporter
MTADRRFSFGVGKINSFAGFASAVMLLGFALVMVI